MTITCDELKQKLETIKGATFATLVTRTKTKARKTGNPFGDIFKVSCINVCLNHHYGNAVNRQQVREGGEGDFEVSPRKWGHRIPGTTMVEHNGAYYIEVKIEKMLGHQYETGSGEVLSDEVVAPFLPPSRLEEQAEAQGVEKAVILRDYNLSSVRAITVKGETYNITL